MSQSPEKPTEPKPVYAKRWGYDTVLGAAMTYPTLDKAGREVGSSKGLVE